MKKIFVVIATLVVITSCYHENKPVVIPPDPLLSRDTLVSILTDVYVAEGIISYQKVHKELPEMADVVYYEKIFEKYHIDHRILKENLYYYSSDPKQMELIMEDVLANLSRLQAEIEKEPQPADTASQTTSDSTGYAAADSTENVQADTLQAPEKDSIPIKK